MWPVAECGRRKRKSQHIGGSLQETEAMESAPDVPTSSG